MTKLFITEYNGKFFRLSSHGLTPCGRYLWNNLEITEQKLIIQDHFNEFFRFILQFSSATDIWEAAINVCSPSAENLLTIHRYFEDAVAAISNEQNLEQHSKQCLIFHTLYNKFGCYLDEFDIIILIEVSYIKKASVFFIGRSKFLAVPKNLNDKILEQFFKYFGHYFASPCGHYESRIHCLQS